MMNDIDVKIHGTRAKTIYATEFLGIIIDSKLTCKARREYICKTLSRYAGIIA